MPRRRHVIWLATAGMLLVGLAVFSFSTGVRAQQKGEFKPHPLTNASREEVEQAAQQYTQVRFNIVSGAPKVLLTRPVTKGDIPTLGLSAIDFAGEDPPLMLVVMKGDFDVINLRHRSVSKSSWPVSYVTYVFDLKAGAPTLIEVSPHGGRFRKLLNDPTLPDDIPQGAQLPGNNGAIQPGPQVAPPQPASAPPAKLPYGATAPGIAEPDGVLPVEK